MQVIEHDTAEALQQHLGSLQRVRDWRRVQAILLARQGQSAATIAAALGCRSRAVQRWVATYNTAGLSALAEKPRSGRPQRLPPEQEPRLRERLDALPQPTDGVCSLRGRDIGRILREEFGVLYSLDGVYGLLHRLGYSCLMPRPRHPKTDPDAQEAWKKKLSVTSPSSGQPAPASRSRSGMRTRPGSAPKGR